MDRNTAVVTNNFVGVLAILAFFAFIAIIVVF
jgi:hypothetical protein